MLQIQKQEANANKLLIYTKAMTLAFHEVSPTYCLFSSPDLNLTINVTAFRNPKISTKACRSCQSTTRSWRLTSSITPACSESRSISTQSTARLSCKASSTFWNLQILQSQPKMSALFSKELVKLTVLNHQLKTHSTSTMVSTTLNSLKPFFVSHS